MVKSLITTAVLLTGLSSQAATTHQCFVMGQSPTNQDTYDVLLADKELDLSKDSGALVYVNETFAVSIRAENGRMQVGSSGAKPDSRKIFALAIAKASEVSLLDGQNQVSIICTAK